MGQLQTISEVKTWKGAPSDVQLKTYLGRMQKTMEGLAFSEIQAQAILDLQLRRISALERQKIIDEYEQVIKHIAELEEILGNERSLRRVIAKSLRKLRKILVTGVARRLSTKASSFRSRI